MCKGHFYVRQSILAMMPLIAQVVITDYGYLDIAIPDSVIAVA